MKLFKLIIDVCDSTEMWKINNTLQISYNGKNKII